MNNLLEDRPQWPWIAGAAAMVLDTGGTGVKTVIVTADGGVVAPPRSPAIPEGPAETEIPTGRETDNELVSAVPTVSRVTPTPTAFTVQGPGLIVSPPPAANPTPTPGPTVSPTPEGPPSAMLPPWEKSGYYGR